MNDWIRSPWLRGALLALTIALGSLALRNTGGQSVNWSYPYYSGAANFQSFGDWRISSSEYARVRDMPATQYRAHRHARTDDTIAYRYNNYGYVLVVLAARSVFPWMGEGNAVTTLQIVTHIALSLIIVGLLRTPVQRGVFILGYAINPLVLHVVTFPYYYFWSVLPAALLAVVWLRRERIRWWIAPIALLLVLACLIRPPVLFLCLLVLAVAFRRGQRVATLAAGAAFVLLLALTRAQTYASPWHTVYIGIGGYSNPYGIEKPLDEYGYAYYHRVTGRQIDTNPLTGSFQDAGERENYWRVLREGYLGIAHERPLLLARNAALNFAESFAFGYDVERRWVSLASAGAGLVMILLIVAYRQWVWGLGILSFAGAFALYFPPIPAYLFGAYLLTALAAGQIAERLLARVLPAQWVSAPAVRAGDAAS